MVNSSKATPRMPVARHHHCRVIPDGKVRSYDLRDLCGEGDDNTTSKTPYTVTPEASKLSVSSLFGCLGSGAS